MSTDKLPEWAGEFREWTFDLDYLHRDRKAALARMEALVEVVTLWRKRMRHSMDEDDLQAVDELLAACEQRKS